MTASHTQLSVENLESRLNLSTLAGISIPAFIDVPIRAQERATLSESQVVSLSEVLSDAQPQTGDAAAASTPATDA